MNNAKSKTKGIWCNRCHYGSPTMQNFKKCPQCGGVLPVTSSPFPAKAEKVGSGEENGKTAARRLGRPNKGKPQAKILERLAARKKFDAAHGTAKGKHIHTVPGSMKKGGGW